MQTRASAGLVRPNVMHIPPLLRVAVAAALLSSAAPVLAPSLNIFRTNQTVTVTWSAPDAVLESAPQVTGPWSNIVAGSPYVTTASEPASFYRLRLPAATNLLWRYLPPTFSSAIGDPVGGCGCTSPEKDSSLTTLGNSQDNGMGSIFLHTGETTQHAVDLEIPGRGFNWRFERRYRSGMNYDGPLGQGWDFNYNLRLAV